MIYYKIPEKYDNCNIYKNGRFTTCVIKNELFTEKECTRLGINKNVLIRIEVSKKRIFWFFGSRYESNI